MDSAGLTAYVAAYVADSFSRCRRRVSRAERRRYGTGGAGPAPRSSVDGDVVDVVGKSKGRGFAGTIKRHNFNRGPESHGSMNVRAPGSIGASAYPSRVVKGMRSSGHMGDERVTIKRLTVARVDAENNLLMIRGAVPGANGSVVVVKKAARQGKK